jgi:hypothetical protein
MPRNRGVAEADGHRRATAGGVPRPTAAAAAAAAAAVKT